MRILVDTNILLRFAEPLHIQHTASVQAVDILDKSGHVLEIVPQVLYEFWAVATRPLENNGLGLNPVDVQSEIRGMKQLFRLLTDESGIFRHWEQLVVSHAVRGKQTHDARLVAAMHKHGISHILTFNAQDFVRYRSISVVSPEEIANGSITL